MSVPWSIYPSLRESALSIEIQCAGCESHLRVADEHAGKQARCPKCGTIQTIPSKEAASEPAAGAELGSSGASAAKSPAALALPPSAPVSAPPSAPVTAPAQPVANPATAWPTALPQGIPLSRQTDFAPDQWTLRTPDGREYGPVPRQELDLWIGENRVSAQCRLRRGLGEWVPATTHYPDLPVGTQDAGVYAAGGWSPTNIYPENHRGGLILTLGILGLIFTCPILSIMAWVMGSKDLGKMKSRVMDPAGEDMTKVGYVLGLFWSLVCIMGMVVVMMLVIAAS